MLKKVSLALLGLSAASIATSGTMGTLCQPSQSTIPCQTKAWELGVDALYLKPGYTGLYSNVISNNQSTELKNRFGFAYDVYGAYHFNTGNSLLLDWLHYDVASKRQSGFFGATIFGNSRFALKQSNEFDRVNFALRQSLSAAEINPSRLYAGLQYASVLSYRRSLYQSPAALQALGGTGLINNNKLSYQGLGPVFGIDLAYSLSQSLDLIADSSSAILFGTSKNINATAILPVNFVALTNTASRNTLSPGLQAKLGLNYHSEFSQGQLSVDAGYQFINYLKPLNALRNDGTVSNSNFSLSGPYLGLNWLGSL